MKLASYRDGSRDGQLVVVSRDLASAHYATGIATRLQQVLDDWNFLSPQLEALSQNLNHGKARHAFAFDPAQCMAPLPRAFAWIAEGGHRASDGFAAPVHGIDREDAASLRADPRLAAALGDVEVGIAPGAALERVRLLLLAADLGEDANAFAPVALTPDELAPAWRGGRLERPVELAWNGKRPVAATASTSADVGDRPHLGELIAAASARRELAAGSLLGSGPLAEPIALQALQPGDRLTIEIRGAEGQALFGAIELRGIGPAEAVDIPQKGAPELA